VETKDDDSCSTSFTRSIRRRLKDNSEAMTMSALVAQAALLVFIFAMVLAALTDLTTMKIPNRLVLLLLAGFAVSAPFAGFDAAEIGWSVAVASGVLAAAFGLFSFGWIGGGDAKLAAATALWFGADYTIAFLVYTALIGGAVSLAILAFRKVPLPRLLAAQSWIARLHVAGTPVPYGVALAAAGLVVIPQTRWMTSIL
jgi:prepilin peptidase CpaA